MSLSAEQKKHTAIAELMESMRIRAICPDLRSPKWAETGNWLGRLRLRLLRFGKIEEPLQIRFAHGDKLVIRTLSLAASRKCLGLKLQVTWYLRISLGERFSRHLFQPFLHRCVLRNRKFVPKAQTLTLNSEPRIKSHLQIGWSNVLWHK